MVVTAKKAPKYITNIEAVVNSIALIQTKIALENPDLFLMALAIVSVHSIEVIVYFFLSMLLRHNCASLRGFKLSI